jgi:hypothetical protein
MKTELGMNTLMELIYALRLNMHIKQACLNDPDADEEAQEQYGQDLMFMMEADSELASYYEEARPGYPNEDLPDYATLVARLKFPAAQVEAGRIALALGIDPAQA